MLVSASDTKISHTVPFAKVRNLFACLQFPACSTGRDVLVKKWTIDPPNSGAEKSFWPRYRDPRFTEKTGHFVPPPQPFFASG